MHDNVHSFYFNLLLMVIVIPTSISIVKS